MTEILDNCCKRKVTAVTQSIVNKMESVEFSQQKRRVSIVRFTMSPSAVFFLKVLDVSKVRRKAHLFARTLAQLQLHRNLHLFLTCFDPDSELVAGAHCVGTGATGLTWFGLGWQRCSRI